MSWTKTNQILQTSANFGIILGLVLVGLQIKDTNRIATAEFLSKSFDQKISGLDLIVGDNLGASWARAANNPAELTDTDLVTISAYLQRLWYQTIREENIAALGNEGSEFTGTATVWAERILSVEPAYRWWTAQQEGLLVVNFELRDEINAHLVKLKEKNSERQSDVIEAMRNGPLYPESVSDQF
jgi:hypothetical protein